MGTTKSAVSRLESGGKHAPSAAICASRWFPASENIQNAPLAERLRRAAERARASPTGRAGASSDSFSYNFSGGKDGKIGRNAMPGGISDKEGLRKMTGRIRAGRSPGRKIQAA
jgi:hypothetical protein